MQIFDEAPQIVHYSFQEKPVRLLDKCFAATIVLMICLLPLAFWDMLPISPIFDSSFASEAQQKLYLAKEFGFFVPLNIKHDERITITNPWRPTDDALRFVYEYEAKHPQFKVVGWELAADQKSLRLTYQWRSHQ